MNEGGRWKVQEDKIEVPNKCIKQCSSQPEVALSLDFQLGSQRSEPSVSVCQREVSWEVQEGRIQCSFLSPQTGKEAV